MYYVDGAGNVCEAKIRSKGSGKILITGAVQKQKGCLYYVDGAGNVCETQVVRGGKRKRPFDGRLLFCTDHWIMIRDSLDKDYREEDTAVRIVKILSDEVLVSKPEENENKVSDLYTVVFQLSYIPSECWITAFRYIWRHSKAHIASMENDADIYAHADVDISGDKLFVSNTTIEEIESHYKEALEKTVQEANKEAKERLEEQRLERVRQENLEKDYKEKTEDVKRKVKEAEERIKFEH